MFGLRNHRGSCWINAMLQGLFRIPDLQDRFRNKQVDATNPIEVSMEEIWNTRGEDGLRPLFECIKTATMPAGEDIGDAHELLEFLCDKVPFLEKLMRFKVAHTIKCNNAKCTYKDTRNDTLLEFSIVPTRPDETVSNAIVHAVQPSIIMDWTCETCKQKGCTKQLLIASFPQVLIFHQTSVNTSVSYSAVLVVNSIKYALFAVVCFSGKHWWTYGRDLPPGKPWHELNDRTVQMFNSNHFPLDDSMRLLMYYRLNE
jgi:ubiquitin C-terminal hydrolase